MNSNYTMKYTLTRSRRKTICIQIRDNGEISVKAPNRMPRVEIDNFILSKQDWIEKHLTKIAEIQSCTTKLTPSEIEAIADRAMKIIPEKCRKYSSALCVTYGKITIRNQHTRWGSCSSKGNLNFNCLLTLCPDAVIDYVVIHELCHRIEMNHSKAFWNIVESVMPDYKIHRKWLKENGAALFAKLP